MTATTKVRTPFESVVRRGPFAWIYWGAVAGGGVAVVVGIFWGSTEQRIVTGAVVMAGVIALTIARYALANRLERKRAAALTAETDDSHHL